MLDLAAIKNELDITYNDPRVDDKVAGILARAESHIREVCAVSVEGKLTPTEEQLVFDCCRYIYNSAFEDFDANFTGIINGARAARIAAGSDDESGDDTDD